MCKIKISKLSLLFFYKFTRAVAKYIPSHNHHIFDTCLSHQDTVTKKQKIPDDFYDVSNMGWIKKKKSQEEEEKRLRT